MELLQGIRTADNGAALDRLAGTFGISAAQADTVVAAVLPELSQRLERLTLSHGGLADLVALVGTHGHPDGAAHAADHASPAALDSGNAVLQHILGSRDGSRAVAARAAQSTGLSETIIKAMMPYIASLVMRALAKRVSGGLGDILAKLPQAAGGTAGGGTGVRTGGVSPRGSAPANAPWAPSPTPRSAPTSPSTASPLPGPEGMSFPAGRPGGNPYSDLSDIIRTGGGTSVGGNPLWSIVRNVLGGALGFQSRGFVGWLVRLLVMRFGWGLLRSILGGVLRQR